MTAESNREQFDQTVVISKQKVATTADKTKQKETKFCLFHLISGMLLSTMINACAGNNNWTRYRQIVNRIIVSSSDAFALFVSFIRFMSMDGKQNQHEIILFPFGFVA